MTVFVDLLPRIGEFVEGISGDDVATDELHGRVAFRGLLPENRAGKHRVVPAFLPQVDFNLRVKIKNELSAQINVESRGTRLPRFSLSSYRQLVFVGPDSTALSLLNHLFDVHQHWQGHATRCKTETRENQTRMI